MGGTAQVRMEVIRRGSHTEGAWSFRKPHSMAWACNAASARELTTVRLLVPLTQGLVKEAAQSL